MHATLTEIQARLAEAALNTYEEAVFMVNMALSPDKANAPQSEVDKVREITLKYMQKHDAPESLEDRIYVAVMDELILEAVRNGLQVVL